MGGSTSLSAATSPAEQGRAPEAVRRQNNCHRRGHGGTMRSLPLSPTSRPVGHMPHADNSSPLSTDGCKMLLSVLTRSKASRKSMDAQRKCLCICLFCVYSRGGLDRNVDSRGSAVLSVGLADSDTSCVTLSHRPSQGTPGPTPITPQPSLPPENTPLPGHHDCFPTPRPFHL